MSNAFRSICAMTGALILITGASAFAQDWSQWRGANRDGNVTGFTAPQSWPKELAPKWKYSVGDGDATPALVRDRLYVFVRQGEDEVLLCLNAKGQEVWRDKYKASEVTGAASSHPGPRSSPTVVNGKVVTLGAGGVLSCLDAAKGAVVWRKDEFAGAVPRFFTSSSPIVVDGMAIAQLGGQGNGAIMAYDLNTGAQKWKWAGEGPGYASPVLLTAAGVKQIVALTDKSVVGVAAADGRLLWQIPFAPQGMGYNAATPTVDGDTLIYTGQGRGTKAVKIEKQGDGFVTKEIWSNPDLGAQFSSPVLRDGHYYGLSDKGLIFCLNAKTGQTEWVDTTKRGGNYACIVNAGPVVMALPKTGGLIVFKPGDKQYEQLADIKVSDAETYAYPVVSGNRIFVKDQYTLAEYTID